MKDICDICKCSKDLDCAGVGINLHGTFLRQTDIWGQSMGARNLDLQGNTFDLNDLHHFLTQNTIHRTVTYNIDASDNINMCDTRLSGYTDNVHLQTDVCASVWPITDTVNSASEANIGALWAVIAVLMFIVDGVIAQIALFMRRYTWSLIT